MGPKFRVGNWLVEPDLNRMVRPDRTVQIEPKVMDVLAFLASHAGEVCPKDTIIKAVWPGVFVSDDVLSYSIFELRKAFGDNARDPSVIATITKRGYRLIAPVSWLQEEASRHEILSDVNPLSNNPSTSTAAARAKEDPPPLSLQASGITTRLESEVTKTPAGVPRERYQEMMQERCDLEKVRPAGNESPATTGAGKWTAASIAKAAAALISIALLVTLLLWYLLPSWLSKTNRSGIVPPGNAAERSIAVIPFENLSPDPQNAFFAEGFTEDLINNLSKIGHLRVISLSAVARYSGEAAVPEIDKDLGVEMILKGSVRREDGQVRISTQLIEAKTARYLWGETYDRDLAGIFRIQSDVAGTIAAKLSVTLSAAEKARLQKEPTANLTAYDYYLKGREYYRRYRSHDNENAIALFEKALQLDSNLALARAGLADCYAQRVYQFGFPAEWTDNAIEASKKALSIDPDLAEAHKALGLAHAVRDRLQEALKSYYRAVELNPNFSAPVSNIAVILEQQGKYFEALQWTRRALSLNPTESISYFNVGDLYWDLHDLDRAEEWYKKALSLGPDYEPARLAMNRIHVVRKNYPEALKEIQRILSLNSTSPRGLSAAGHTYLASGNLAKAEECYRRTLAIGPNGDAAIHLSLILWKRGAKDEAQKLSAPLMRTSQRDIDEGSEAWRPWWVIAVVRAAQGDTKEAIPLLERAAAAGWRPPPGAWDDPHYENLLRDERFRSLMAALKEDVDEQRRRALLLAASPK